MDGLDYAMPLTAHAFPDLPQVNVLDDPDPYSNYFSGFSSYHDVDALPPLSMSGESFQPAPPTNHSRNWDDCASVSFEGYFHPDSLHSTWPSHHRDSSPVLSNHSSNSSCYNVGNDTFSHDIDSGSVSCPYPPFGQHPVPREEGSLFPPPHHHHHHHHGIRLSQVQTQPDRDSYSSFYDDNRLPFPHGRPFNLAAEDDDSDAGATYHADNASDAQDDELDSYASDADDSEYTPAHSKPKRSSLRKNGPQLHTTSKGRVSKKSAPALTTSKRGRRSVSSAKSPTNSDSEGKPAGPYSCPLRPYGCQQTFQNKNEWKRHVITQHLCLEGWRCDMCLGKDGKPHDFNRKDLFREHLKRCHEDIFASAAVTRTSASAAAKKQRRQSSDSKEKLDEASNRLLQDICDRCQYRKRQPPAVSICAFCHREFRGQGSCEDWLEHTGKHLASLVKSRSTARGDDLDDAHGTTTAAAAADVDVGAGKWGSDVKFREWLLECGDIVPTSRQGSWALAKNVS